MPGIYIHIPFCKQACHYCNFHFSTSLRLKDELVAALIKEIDSTPFHSGRQEQVESIYFGGGTPSLLSIDDLSMILEAVQEKFVITANAEITLEANPDDIDAAKLTGWKNKGINRLSVGIQSFAEEELVWMNRAHTAAESLQCIEAIRQAGFENFSIDLIYGSPLLNNDHWKRNVDIVIEQRIPHISCYALTVEPKTALAKLIALHKKADTDAGRQAEQFLLLMQWMQQAGYEHYEISNYALPGMRSRHNSSYWQGNHYYGFGPSAHSFNGSSRRWNIANNAAYIKSMQENIIPSEEEILSATQRLNEYIMTSLRTIEGLDLERIKDTFGDRYSKDLLKASIKWQETDKVVCRGSALLLTGEGKLFADGIAADLFF